MCVCVSMYVCIYISVHIHTYVRTYIHTCTYKCIDVYTKTERVPILRYSLFPLLFIFQTTTQLPTFPSLTPPDKMKIREVTSRTIKVRQNVTI